MLENNEVDKTVVHIIKEVIISADLFTMNVLISLTENLIIPYKGYFSFFPRYCSIMKGLEIDFEIFESNGNLKIAFSSKKDDSIELEKYFNDFSLMIRGRNIARTLKKEKGKKYIDDMDLFHKFSLRMEENIRHVNKIFYLERGVLPVFHHSKKT